VEMIKNPEACARFGLRDGQFFAHWQKKNQHWFLNGKWIGFGDIRGEDIERIQAELKDGEKFEGFNEHHMSRFMQRENPVICIDMNSVVFPDPIPVTPETRARVYEQWGR
jgi:hypothetical protein